MDDRASGSGVYKFFLTLIVLAPRGGGLDDQPAIQKALDAVNEPPGRGGVVHLTSGTYYIGPADGEQPEPVNIGKYSLRIDDNTHLKMDEDVVLVRRFLQYSEDDATIRNKGFTGDDQGVNRNIRISGGTITTENAQNEGMHLGFVNTDHLTLENIRIEGVENSWNISLVDCNDVLVTGLAIDSGDEVHEDGLHLAGGSRIVVSDCNITCGDDAIAIVQTPNGLFPTTTACTDASISNCTLWSKAANAIKLLREDPAEGPDPPDPPPPLAWISISNIVARCGPVASSGGLVITDLNEDNQVTDVTLDGLLLDASDNGLNGLYIVSVERVRLSDVIVTQPNWRSVIDDAVDVALLDCVVDSPGAEDQACLIVAENDDCENIRIIGGSYLGATFHSIILGAEGTVTGFDVTNTRVFDAPLVGILLQNATLGKVLGNRVRYCDTYGIQETGDSNFNQIIGNQIHNSGLAPLLFVGTSTEVVRNTSNTVIDVKDSGGFRQTIDGWTWDVSLAGLSGDEMPRDNFDPTNNDGAGRFRAVREGSLTGLVITTDAPRTAGTLTAEVYINTGDAGDPGAPTGLIVSLNATHPNRHAATQAPNLATFQPGDEIYIVLTSSTSPAYAPSNAKIRCALEVED